MKTNFHTHNYRCGHAVGNVEDYVKVAIQCNKSALLDFPAGKYHPKYGADSEESARGLLSG